METLIFLGVIIIAALLGRYAVAEGHRIESQKKFLKNMNEFDTRKRKTK